jgi:peptidoglycan/LPS O-acetylase OafA/YrhL
MSSASETAAPQGRIVAYDALRLFAILTVVAIHTLMPYRDVLPPSAPIRVFDDVLHYAVPLFVFISGALVWARPWPRERGSYPRFLRRRFAAIGLPYLAWAALYAALYVARANDTARALSQVPGLVASGHVWYHLYFVPMLLTFYLLTPLAAGALRRSPEFVVLGAYALRIVLGPSITHALSDVHPLLGQYGIHVLSHLPHMALGAWFALRLDRIWPAMRRLWPLRFAGGLALLTYLAAAGVPPILPLGLHRLLFPGAMALTVLGLALGALQLEPRYASEAQTVTHLGSLSFGVYFTHPLFLLAVFEAAGPASDGALWWRPWFPLLIWAGVSALSLATGEQLRRFRASAWLVGLPPASR